MREITQNLEPVILGFHENFTEFQTVCCIREVVALAIFRRFSVRLLGIFHERTERREFENIIWQAVETI